MSSRDPFQYAPIPWATGESVSPPVNTQQYADIPWATQTSLPESLPGPIEYIRRLSQGMAFAFTRSLYGSAADVQIARLRAGYGDPEDLEKAVKYDQAAKQRSGPWLDTSVGDATKTLFKQVFAEPVKQLGIALRDPVAFATAIKENPSAIITGLEKPFGDFFEAAVGIDVTSGEYRPLMPEERQERLENAAGFTASLAAGIGSFKLLNNFTSVSRNAKLLNQISKTPIDDLSKLGISDDVIQQIAGTGKLTKGRIAEHLGFSTLAGAVAGGTYGLVAGYNDEDQLAQIISNGILFAPVGLAFDLLPVVGPLGGAKKQVVANAASAQRILQSFQ